MPHDCIVPSEPRNPPRADDYRLLAVQIREIARATRMASAHRELARPSVRYEERATLIDHREYSQVTVSAAARVMRDLPLLKHRKGTIIAY